MSILYGPDGFAVASDQLLSAYDANWAKVFGTVNLQILAANDFVAPSGVDDAVIYRLTSIDNAWQRVTAVVYGANAGCEIAVGGFVASDGNGYFVHAAGGEGSFRILKGNSFTNIGNFSGGTGGLPAATPTTITVTFAFNSGTGETEITLQVGAGTPETLVDATSPFVSGCPGIFAFANPATGSRIDDYQVEDQAAGGTAVEPGVGGIALVGPVPTINIPFATTPAQGGMVLAGPAPTILTPRTVSPEAGAVVLAGPVPSVGGSGGGVQAVPGVGAIVLAGFAPTPTLHIEAETIDTQSFVAAGATVEIVVEPVSGSIVVAGPAPVLVTPQTVTPDTGAVAVAGPVPVVSIPFAATIDAGTITLVGPAPTIIADGSVFVIPGVGAIFLTGFAPEAFAAGSWPSDLIASARTPSKLNGIGWMW